MQAAANMQPAAITLDDLPVAACIYAPSGHIIASNERAQTVLRELGLKKPFMLNEKTLAAHVDIAQALTKHFETGALVKLVRDNGQIFWVSPCPQGSLLIITTQPANEESQMPIALSAHMAAALAHEIRNPLLSIKGGAALLEKSLNSAEDKELAELIHREATRVETLMQTLDPLSPSSEQHYTRVNIHQVLDHAVRVIKTITPSLTITTHYDPSIPEIYADESRLIQVCINLMHNACDAMKHLPNPTVHITTRIAAQPHPLCITIRDEGCGVPDAIRDRLFMPFVTTKSEGKGLGLSIAQAIIQQHGGMLTYAAVESGGSEFTIQLPLKKI